MSRILAVSAQNVIRIFGLAAHASLRMPAPIFIGASPK
jgi:hypothetical protein